MRVPGVSGSRLSRITDVVLPETERLRALQYLRAALVALVVLAGLLAPATFEPHGSSALAVTAGYAALVAVAEVLRRTTRAALPVLAPALLVLDGLWLAAGAHLTGDLDSPLRYAIVVHVAAVALLASARTALAVTGWHNVLLVAVGLAERSGLLTRSDRWPTGAAGGPAGRQGAFTLALWLIVLTTSLLSAVNERELRHRRIDLEALTRLAETLERSGDSAEVARALLDSVTAGSGKLRALVLAGPDEAFPLLASTGLPEAVARYPGPVRPLAVVEQALRERLPLRVDALDPEADAWLVELLPAASALLVMPMAADGRPVGALVVEPPPGQDGWWSRRTLASLERSAAYASLALRNAWLLEQVQRLAATDSLTRIANRRTFEAALQRELTRSGRSGEPVSLVLLDIDHFKDLNDAHGHQVGDEVLVSVAGALTGQCRDIDTAARYGGEEFAVVLPGCDPHQAAAIAERLRAAVVAAWPQAPVTASAGLATYPSHAADAESLVRAADRALYRSKATGRNRTTSASEERGMREHLLGVLVRDARPAVPAPSPADVRADRG